MAARNEHGTPSALTVLEVAEGLRWTDPALGASLAEHVRRVSGDDPAVRAAADRSVLRSLVESDRYADVVERGVPLLAEARGRGDRDDGAAVLVDLAVSATELGDAGLARRLLDRLGPLDELPARVGAGACVARAEAFATDGDVPATDAAAAAAGPVLFRVPRQEAAVLRARVALARGVARRRAGDVDGALTTLAAAVSADPAGDVDGGRRSMAAAAEETELLVEAGRHDEARDRARRVLTEGSHGPHVARAVGRIRLASLAAPGSGSREAATVAEELEAAGWTAEAARAWELVSSLAETEGDLGRALAALRRGHGLTSTGRDAGARALRTLAAVADGADPLAAGPVAADDGSAAPTSERERGVRGGRRRRPEPTDAEPFPTTGPAPTGVDLIGIDVPVGRNGTTPAVGTTADGASRAWSVDAPEVSEPQGTPEPPAVVGTAAVQPRDLDDVGAGDAGVVPDPGPSRSTRDELAELLASLTRSMDSSRASASAMGLEPAPAMGVEPTPTSGDGRQEPDLAPRSRHSAPATSSTPTPAQEPTSSRPTFDAFSTAPLSRPGSSDGNGVAAPVAPLPEDRFAPPDDGAAADRPWAGSALDDAPASVSSLVDALGDPLGDSSAGSTADPSSSPSREDTAASRPTSVDAGEELALANGRSGTDEPTGSGGRAPADAVAARNGAVEPDRDTAADPGATVPDLAENRGPERATGAAESTAGPSEGDAGSGSRMPVDPSPSSGADETPGAPTGGTARPRERARESVESVESVEPAGERDASTVPGTGRRPDERAGPQTEVAGTESRARAKVPSPEPRDRRQMPSGTTSAAGRPAARALGEYEEDLALTLATVLGEYHLPDVPMPPRRENVGSAQPPRASAGSVGSAGSSSGSDVSVPSARRHTSGSMPVPGDQRRAALPESGSNGARGGAPEDARRDAAGANGRGRPPESGAKLADLLAEAMDAFRHVGPETQEGSRGPGVGSRRA
ncbi:hypothetical protein [Actinomycetospora soli]|uniref:hypothetical protein n=1 Tax=Actinomycetospora soli TaxID=2893887 RepID=UPI001E2F02EA|nr:hypothetical protein [Actinomycetospora soli]MCD2191752.1 hypothetical protein [Actinomycetospora soli]